MRPPRMHMTSVEAEIGKTIDFLVDFSARFLERVDLGRIRHQIATQETSADRMDVVLFTVSHLLLTGAIAEENVLELRLGGQLPGRVSERIARATGKNSSQIEFANREAWIGTSIGQPNVLGAIAFSVSVMFFFEGFCRLVLGFEGDRRKKMGHIRRGDVPKGVI